MSDNHPKLVISIMLLLSSIIFYLSFHSNATPQIILFLVILLLAMSLFCYDYSRNIHYFVIIIITTTISITIINPVRVDLLGVDAYNTLNNIRQVGSHINIVEFQINSGDRPAFYLLVKQLQVLTQLNNIIILKYLPIVAVVFPIIFYAIVSRISYPSLALFMSVGIISMRTLWSVESKSSPELLGFLLFYSVVLTVIMKKSTQSRNSSILLFLFVIGVSEYHKFSSFVVLILLFFLPLIKITNSLFGKFDMSGSSYSVKPEINVGPTTIWLFLFVLIFEIAQYLYLSQNRFGVFLNLILDGIFGNPLATKGSISGTSNVSSGLLPQLASYGNLLLLVALALGNAWFFTKYKKYENYYLSFVLYNGSIAALYSVLMFYGRIIPIDPIRLYTFLFPMLLLPIAKIIGDANISISHSSFWKHTFRIAILLIIIIHLVVAPHGIFKSEIGESAVDGTYRSQEQFSASQHISKYGESLVLGWEKGTWISHSNSFTPLFNSEHSQYDEVLISCYQDIEWISTQRVCLNKDGTVYDSGDLHLNYNRHINLDKYNITRVGSNV